MQATFKSEKSVFMTNKIINLNFEENYIIASNQFFSVQYEYDTQWAMMQTHNHLPACPALTMRDQITMPHPLILTPNLNILLKFYEFLGEIGDFFTIYG